MELELQKERFDCYRCAAPFVSTQEESAETIVPDYSPDIARIVDVNACLLLRGQTVADGRLTASGSVKLTLLYMAEGAQGLRSLSYTIPFEHSEELPSGCDKASVEGRVCGAETRLLNPRKLFTRLDIEWRVAPYCRTVFTACGTITEQETYSIETLCEKREVSLICAVNDKDFVFSDELAIPGGREAIGELLCSRVKLRVSEAKSIGSKVILKGVACVCLIYATEDGKLCSYDEELPFSQILDGISQEEGGEYAVSAVLNLSGSEIHTAEGGDGHTVSVKLSLNAFVVLRRTETVGCITDLYSTAYELDAQMENVELWQAPETTSLLQSVREQLDTGTDVKSVVCADVCFGSVGVRQEGGRAVARAAAVVSALYLDEAGVPSAVRRNIEITAEGNVSGDAQAAVESVCAGDITANINADGVELRFSAEFTVTSASASEFTCLTGLSVSETEGTGAAPAAPSLVLRALRDGETLWNVAKQYRTTVEEILSANELADSAALEAGQMLLIPRKR